jgi:hypothetical protein
LSHSTSPPFNLFDMCDTDTIVRNYLYFGFESFPFIDVSKLIFL